MNFLLVKVEGTLHPHLQRPHCVAENDHRGQQSTNPAVGKIQRLLAQLAAQLHCDLISHAGQTAADTHREKQKISSGY